MRHLLLIALVSAGCVESGGDDDMQPDGDPIGQSCPIAITNADMGALSATKAQMCNVPGSMGTAHWYKLATAMPGSMNYVQVDLWDKLGAFAGGTVHTGTFTIAGDDANPDKCGVCVRALGAKGTAEQKTYFATGGTVNVTAVGAAGQPISATLSNISFVEIDPTSHKPVAGGCAMSVAGAKLDGTLVQVGGTGGGGGGGGSSGGGCLPGIAD